MTDRFNALEIARNAAVEDSRDSKFVGELVSIDQEDERIATYLFEASIPGYFGWRWAVTIIRLDDESPATIADVVLLPGEDSLIAPEWIPYKERIEPGDLGVGDIIPTSADDLRLVPGFEALPGDEDLALFEQFELGLGRARVLSIVGRDAASKRWYEGDRGPNAPIAQFAPHPCHTCGFFIPISGSLRSAFGVCANALSPEDAHVVSADHGCGAHSEAFIVPE
jgi:hypothetical protein